MKSFFLPDIEECKSDLQKCDQICIELNGSYECSCNAGYQLQSDNATCSGTNFTYNVMC